VRIAGVRQALAVLGLRRTANLVGALVIRRAFPSSLNPGMARFWRVSSRDAQAAVDLAPGVRRIEADEARTFSLLRRCGMAVLMARYRDYEDMLDLAATAPGEQVLQAENGRYGTNHAQVGHALALRWMLPADLTEAIRWQYVPEDFAAVAQADPSTSNGSALAMICFGLLLDQVLASRTGGGILRDWSRYEARVLECLLVTPDSIVEMIQHDEADEACMEAEPARAAA
jgi:HD-like signal output (HDOD) protein